MMYWKPFNSDVLHVLTKDCFVSEDGYVFLHNDWLPAGKLVTV